METVISIILAIFGLAILSRIAICCAMPVVFAWDRAILKRNSRAIS